MVIFDAIERDILSTLFKHGCVGKRNTTILNLCKSLNHYSCKEIKEGIGSLRKQELINLYKTKQGINIRIIPSQLKKVKIIIEEKLIED